MTASDQAPSVAAPVVTPELGRLITELQSKGLRVERPFETRRGGAGPADAGMIWVEGVAVTVPAGASYVAGSPFVLRGEDDGLGHLPRRRPAGHAPTRCERPRFYDLATADGVPYWKIALLHLDSLASTVLQTCAYWGNGDQCAFCGIGVSLAGRPHHRQEDARPAGRGGGGRPGPRRRGRRHPDDRQHGRARPWRPATSAAAARPSRRPPACRSRCSSSRRPTST